MPERGTEERPVRVAIVGSGPSGFYAAEALFKADAVADVDMYDRLPTPYGLVRGGVAPDHPKIKRVADAYERIAENSRFQFFGNVTLGADLSVHELRRHYDAVIVATGAGADRRLNIPGEDLPGSHTATEFVGWYNGQPEYRSRDFDLSHETAAIIGHGNVALDVARILAKPAEELHPTDITSRALRRLKESRVRRIYVIGRRGPVQSRFTHPELKEIGALPGWTAKANPKDLEVDAEDLSALEDTGARTQRKNFALFELFAANWETPADNVCEFRFLESPVEIQGKDRVEGLRLEVNRLAGEAGERRPEPTGAYRQLDCGLVFRSVGYRGVALPGLPFDKKAGTIPHHGGRVLCAGKPLPGVYVTGWIKRGPSGIIGTNKPDSAETVASMLRDLPNLPECPEPSTKPLRDLLEERGAEPVTFGGWKRLDEAERERGESRGKVREKFTRVEEMVKRAQQENRKA